MDSIYISLQISNEDKNILISHTGYGSEYLYKSELIDSFVNFCLSKSESKVNFIEKDIKSYDCDTCQSSYESLCDLQKHCYSIQDSIVANKLPKLIEHCETSVVNTKSSTSTDFVSSNLPCDNYLTSAEQSTPVSLNTKNFMPENYDVCEKKLIPEDIKSNIKYIVVQNLNSKSSKLVCQFCEKQFSTGSYLKYHQFSVHNFPEKKPNHLCAHCGKNYYYRSQLNNHLAIHDNTTHFSCQRCGKLFKTNQNLQRHMKSHMTDKVYLCSHCDKRFKIEHSLIEHVLHKHTQDRPYACHLCAKSFATRDKLRKHGAQHLKPKISRPQRLIFECLKCGRVCKDRHTLVAHERIHFGIRPFHCKYCGKTFTYKHHVKKHMKNLFCLKVNTNEAWTTSSARTTLDNNKNNGQFVAVNCDQSVVSIDCI